MSPSQRVVVAGGGPAAIEALLALRELAGDRASLELITPGNELVVRAYEVLAPFHEGQEHRYALPRIAQDLDVTLVRDELVGVDASRRAVALRSGSHRQYDALIIAVGAREVGTVTGATTFRGAKDAAKLKALLIESLSGRHQSVAFVVPAGHSWPLPLYELALHTSLWLSERGVTGVPLSVVSPEPHPLAAFGAAVSTEVTALLQSHGVRYVHGHAIRHDPGRLLMTGGGHINVDMTIALVRLAGPAIHGIPSDPEGFINVDEIGRVPGLPRVFAAGDATDFPLKQGGLATQQADAIATALAGELGADVPPAQNERVLRAVLYGGRERRYLRAQLGDAVDESSQASATPLWPESSKLLGRYLAPYLDQLDVVGDPPAARSGT